MSLLIAAALMQATSPSPAIPPGAKVTLPVWLAKPTAKDISRFYPPEAKAKHLSGKAVIQCTVTLEETLADCQVTEESPEGAGFGSAALSVARYFRIRPMKVNGVPTAGGRITIPMLFQ